MNLTELCNTVPKQIFKDTEAVQMLRICMETTSKVYKDAQIYLGDNEKQEKQVRKMIEKELEFFGVDSILWKGVYSDVEYWFFMHGLLVMRNNKMDQWSFMSRKIPWKEWKSLGDKQK